MTEWRPSRYAYRNMLKKIKRESPKRHVPASRERTGEVAHVQIRARQAKNFSRCADRSEQAMKDQTAVSFVSLHSDMMTTLPVQEGSNA